MFKLIREHKWKALISSVIILLPTLLGLIFYDKLPDNMVTHYGADGVADGRSSKLFAILVIPAILFVIHWIALFFTAADPKNKGQNKKAMGVVFWIIPVMTIVVCVTILTEDVSVAMIALQAFFALLFVVLGNYMPKLKQNSTYGVKVPWTLYNEENWNKTHRLTGVLWVAGGFLILISMLLPKAVSMTVMLIDIIVMIILPIVYSYGLYRKQLKNGECMPISKVMKKSHIVINIVLTAAVLVFLYVMMFTGNIRTQVGDTAFEVEASFYSDITVKYEDIDSIELREQDAPGERTNGFGSPRLSMGTYSNEEFGSYTRYTYTGEDVCIVIKIGDDALVIGGKNEQETRALYDELMIKMS